MSDKLQLVDSAGNDKLKLIGQFHAARSASTILKRAARIEGSSEPMKPIIEPKIKAANISRGVTRKLNAISDRKSTRLNSSHVAISYAVFCLKKKKNDRL